MVARPDLFGACIIDVPFLDMLRYHHFTAFPSWTRGYGSVADADSFAVLRGYSPYHNLKQGACYPPTLVWVGGVDEATLPLHGYKFIAALQNAQGCDNPALLKLVREGGHYVYGTTRAQAAETQADQIAFLVKSLNLTIPDNGVF